MEQTPKEGQSSVHVVRHSKANYAPYTDIMAGQTPEQPMDYEKQPEGDLPEAGITLARKEAEKFFDTLNPQTDRVFIVSSPERRALDTAAIYKTVAHERGVEVVAPEHVRSTVAEEVGDKKIRVLEQLSTKIKNTLVGSVFNPEAHMPKEINWDAVSTSTKEKWQQARAIINADDRGSWGANFFAHGDVIKELFPNEIQTAKEVYETQFRNLLKLAKFGIDKANNAPDKNTKILAFGHENYLGYAMQEYFRDHEVKNCEMITITQEGDGLTMERRGVKVPYPSKKRE